MVEGDIVSNEAINEIINRETGEQHHRGKRDAVANRIKLWPGGVLPYMIDDSIGKFGALLRSLPRGVKLAGKNRDYVGKNETLVN